MRASRLGIAVGLVVFLTAMGSGVSYAFWSASAANSARVKAATVTLTVDGSATAPLSGQYQSGQSLTAPITLTNNGTISLTYTASIASTGGTLLPGSVSIYIWKVANAAACQSSSTIPPGAWLGTFSGLSSAPSESLAAGSSQVLCVRTTANVTQQQQGQTANANLVLTGSNGWQSSDSVAMSPTVYTVPSPVLLPGSAGCSGPPSQKSVDLAWQPVAGASGYRLYFTPKPLPAANPPAFRAVTGANATLIGEDFDTVAGSQQGSGSVSIRAVVNGWESAGLNKTIYFAPNSTGSNAKISCTPIP